MATWQDEILVALHLKSPHKHYQKISAAVGLVVVILLIGALYYELYHQPQEEALRDKVWLSILDLQNQNYQEAFFGTEDYYGFDALANEYALAPTTQIAKYGAGIAALQLKDYENAVYYLNDTHFSDHLLQTLTKITLGDAYSELGEAKKALQAYEAAWKTAEKSGMVAVVAQKLGLSYELADNLTAALKLYQNVVLMLPENTENKKYFQKLVAKLEAALL